MRVKSQKNPPLSSCMNKIILRTMSEWMLKFLVLLSTISIISCDVIVDTEYGPIRGTETDKARQFLGIPYAKPPVGDLRWASPQQPSPWQPDVYNATKNGPGCPQKACTDFLPPLICPEQMSEDCLFLNIWTPLDASNTTSYPVMVFIHGGGYTYGFMESILYDGSNVVDMGKVVFVGVAYRLGILGFLHTGEGDNDIKGNYGIQDQRMALTWIKTNIRGLGGNPDLVTIFGQSAGAQSVAVHLASRQSDDLFQRAIVQSSPFAVPFRSKKDAVSLANVISKNLKCSIKDTNCLKTKSADELLDAQQDSLKQFTSTNLLEYVEPIGPVVDGIEVVEQLFEAAQNGNMRDIPVIIGSVTEEFRLFLYEALTNKMSRLKYRAAVAVFHPSHFLSVEFKYPPPSDTSDLRDTLSQVLTDYLFTCAARNVMKSLMNNGNKNVYRYIFDHASVSKGSWGNFTFCEGHVCHSEELAYIFGNSFGSDTTSTELDLYRTMVTYWTNFAHTGNPNTGPVSQKETWPTYSPFTSSTMKFKTPKSEMILNYRDDFCDFWDSIGFQV